MRASNFWQSQRNECHAQHVAGRCFCCCCCCCSSSFDTAPFSTFSWQQLDHHLGNCGAVTNMSSVGAANASDWASAWASACARQLLQLFWSSYWWGRHHAKNEKAKRALQGTLNDLRLSARTAFDFVAFIEATTRKWKMKWENENFNCNLADFYARFAAIKINI